MAGAGSGALLVGAAGADAYADSRVSATTYIAKNADIQAGTDEILAVVDWEMVTVGDPLLDLGWLLATWPGPEGATGSPRPARSSTRISRAASTSTSSPATGSPS